MCFRYHICFSSNQNTKYVCTHNIINIITTTRDTKRRKVSPVSVVIARSISSHATATLFLSTEKDLSHFLRVSKTHSSETHSKRHTRRRRRKTIRLHSAHGTTKMKLNEKFIQHRQFGWLRAQRSAMLIAQRFLVNWKYIYYSLSSLVRWEQRCVELTHSKVC